MPTKIEAARTVLISVLIYLGGIVLFYSCVHWLTGCAPTADAATLYRNGSQDVTKTDYGLLPANAPTVGDVLMASKNGTQWTNLTNIVNALISAKLNPTK